MDLIQNLISKFNDLDLWENDLVIKRNDFLKQANTLDTNIYYIESGSFRISVFDQDEEHTIRFGYQNEMIMALDSFLSNQPSELCIQALKKSKVKVLSQKVFRDFISSAPEHQMQWTQILENFVLQQMERERDILITSPALRYQRVLQRSPRLFQEIPNKYIASYLRMTPETLSRIKS